MADPFFFGYGSLVNSGTHAYPEFHPATLPGWRRAWRRAHGRAAAYVTVMRDPTSSIEGVIASVPGADWQALDAREAAYARVAVPDVRHPLARWIWRSMPLRRMRMRHRPGKTRSFSATWILWCRAS